MTKFTAGIAMLASAWRCLGIRAQISWVCWKHDVAMDEACELREQGYTQSPQYRENLRELESYERQISRLRLRLKREPAAQGHIRQCAGICDQGRQQCQTPDLCRRSAPIFHQVLVGCAIGFLLLVVIPRALT